MWRCILTISHVSLMLKGVGQSLRSAGWLMHVSGHFSYLKDHILNSDVRWRQITSRDVTVMSHDVRWRHCDVIWHPVMMQCHVSMLKRKNPDVMWRHVTSRNVTCHPVMMPLHGKRTFGQKDWVLGDAEGASKLGRFHLFVLWLCPRLQDYIQSNLVNPPLSVPGQFWAD